MQRGFPGGWPSWFFCGVLAVVAMSRAHGQAWLCDDAFISLRYAENLVAGHGLVFNAGEYVEGYSNFLWVMLTALALVLGIDPIAFVQALGILCLGFTVIVTHGIARRLWPGATVFPVAVLLVASHSHLLQFASCGLETLGFVLLVTWAAGLLVQPKRSRNYFLASLATVLAAMTRPDGGLVGAVASIRVLWLAVQARSWRPVIWFSVPGFVLFLPFLVWRYSYYGDWLPNTFYAKSAHDPYPGQGLFYVISFLNAYWIYWPAVVATLVMPWFGRRLGALSWLAALSLTYLGFVVWVGGDFMFARFCLPMVPLWSLLLSGMLQRWLSKSWLLWASAAIFIGLLAWREPQDMMAIGQTVRGVADERAQYPLERTVVIRQLGRRLREMMGDTPLRVAFSGTQAMLVYEAKVPYALEAVTGLTDRFLARQPVGERGHVGHEKGIFRSWETTEYALRERGVHLLLFDWPDKTAAFPFLRVEIDGTACTLVRWDRDVMRRLLHQPRVIATDLESWMDDYLARIGEIPLPQLQADFHALELVYFRWNDDLERKERFNKHINNR
jgi:hypothetical protein